MPATEIGGESGPLLTPSRRLPTRVSNACRRCRRNKSRCDSYRPCSLCLRAQVQCEPGQPQDSFPRGAHGRKTRQRAVTPTSLRVSNNKKRSEAIASASPTVGPSPQPASEAAGETQYRQSGSSRLPEPCLSQEFPVHNEADSAMGIARKISKLGNQQDINVFPTSAIPDGSNYMPNAPVDTGARLPIMTILGSRFPKQELVCELVEEYFDAVHWFSLVIYEPTFRARLATVDDGNAHPSDVSFLTLLSMVLCMAAWYRAAREAHEEAGEWHSWSVSLLGVVESHLINLMDETSLTAVQTCILLGSHHVYHGRPNLSFSLLGATIKIAHTLRIHRSSPHQSLQEAEECKRVWWTIYTWDRFASISYGRPLSINDEDDSLEFPREFPESPHFSPHSSARQLPGIIYSRYQTELSSLYRIASPALKVIFGCISTQTSRQRFESEYASQVSQITEQLHAWRRRLPQHLTLDLSQDFNPRYGNWNTRAHTRQSLSLQLTFDNLLIVLYRPFLARQVEHLSIEASKAFSSSSKATSPASGVPNPSSSESAPSPIVARSIRETTETHGDSEYWLSAAVRTSQIAELPELAQLAKDSHLVAFMAINLFHAAIVLILLALSDPLSDRAQQLKRTITRVLRLQQNLGRKSALAKQSSLVLQNLISLLLKREQEVMLSGESFTHDAGGNVQGGPDRAQLHSTLRGLNGQAQQLEATGINLQHGAATQTWPDLSVAHLLNESLTSVQGVLPTYWEPWQANAARPSVDEGGQMLNSEPGQSSADHQGTTGIESGTNGLFWLWDFNWDSGYMQP